MSSTTRTGAHGRPDNDTVESKGRPTGGGCGRERIDEVRNLIVPQGQEPRYRPTGVTRG